MDKERNQVKEMMGRKVELQGLVGGKVPILGGIGKVGKDAGGGGKRRLVTSKWTLDLGN